MSREEKKERSERAKSTARRGCTQNRDTQRNSAPGARCARLVLSDKVGHETSPWSRIVPPSLEGFIVCDATSRRKPAEGQELANSRLLVSCEFLEADVAAPDPCMSAA